MSDSKQDSFPTDDAFLERRNKAMSLIRDRARQSGYSDNALNALLDLDMSQFRWRRNMIKGDFIARLQTQLGTGLENMEFEALMALMRLRSGYVAEKKSEVVIGDIASELNIDPSRASRLVTGLVDKGYVRRAASQSDGRKSVLVPTNAADALLTIFLDFKWTSFLSLFADWSEAELQSYALLFQRHTTAAFQGPMATDIAPEQLARYKSTLAAALSDSDG